MARTAALVTAIFLCGCSIAFKFDSDSVRSVLDPARHYRYDMQFIVGSEDYDGVGVLSASSEPIVIRGSSPGSIDLLKVTTCHRQDVYQRVGSKRFVYTYAPVKTIEDSGSCFVKFEAYNYQGIHAIGLLEFQDSDADLPASVLCNGREIKAGGASICQSAEGLEQAILFVNPVQVNGCGIQGRGKSAYYFKMPKGECVVAFQDMNTGQFHRLQLVGYEEVAVR